MMEIVIKIPDNGAPTLEVSGASKLVEPLIMHQFGRCLDEFLQIRGGYTEASSSGSDKITK